MDYAGSSRFLMRVGQEVVGRYHYKWVDLPSESHSGEEVATRSLQRATMQSAIIFSIIKHKQGELMHYEPTYK